MKNAVKLCDTHEENYAVVYANRIKLLELTFENKVSTQHKE